MSAILDIAPNLPGGGRQANPIAGVQMFMGLCWGPGSYSALSVILSIPGASINEGFSLDGVLPNVVTAPYVGWNLGWAPDGKLIYLTPGDCAYGLWAVTFPTAGNYTLTLGELGSQVLTAVVPASPVSTVTLELLNTRPLGNLQSRVFAISFNGNYPAGGFPVFGADLGLGTPFFAHINDTAQYRFAYDPTGNVIHTYNASGEIATGGALSFTTTGLFHGSSQ